MLYFPGDEPWDPTEEDDDDLEIRVGREGGKEKSRLATARKSFIWSR